MIIYLKSFSLYLVFIDAHLYSYLIIIPHLTYSLIKIGHNFSLAQSKTKEYS